MAQPKYIWRIGSPPPMLDHHSQVKHDIVEEYVSRYVLTLMKPAQIPKLTFTIVDGFSGGGCYLSEKGDVVDGSPLLMMRAVREARTRLNVGRDTPRQINAEFIFCDILSDTTDYLRFWLNAKREENAIDAEDFSNKEIITNDFLKAMPGIIQKIKARKGGERVLFVLDQYCYKDIPLKQVAHIMSALKAPEIIMTLNVDNLTTYLSNRASNRKAVQNIGLDAYIPWEELKYLKAEKKREWRRIMQRYLAHGIKCETGAKFITLFFVKPFGENTWSYWLIHLTNNYRAHDVMKSIHWKHCTEFGHELEPGVFILGYDANHDVDYTGQPTFEFSEEKSEELCINGIMEHFAKTLFERDKPIQLAELFKEFITLSPAAESHSIEAVRRLRSTNNFAIKSEDGKAKGLVKTYKLSDVIEPTRQIFLFTHFDKSNQR